MTAELIEKQMVPIFPTLMFTGKLPDLSLCDRIEQTLRGLQKAGKGKSSPDRASPAFLTDDTLHKMPEMNEIVEIILRESGRILDAYAIKRDSHYITDMWANITHPNHRQHMHVHPNCLLSGLVYIKTPLSCGPTMFASPRKFTKQIEPTYTVRNELNSDFIVIPAEKGRMLIWPSHMPHAVESGTAIETEDRITMPFNIMIRGSIELFTANLELN